MESEAVLEYLEGRCDIGAETGGLISGTKGRSITAVIAVHLGG